MFEGEGAAQAPAPSKKIGLASIVPVVRSRGPAKEGLSIPKVEVKPGQRGRWQMACALGYFFP